jgi:alkylhydroperoxidase family enzyme
MQTGADEDKIREVPAWRESPRFSEMERVALEYAEAMTITGQRVGDELFARLRALFDDAQIVELTAAVALENFRSKFNVPLGIEAQGFCILPHLPAS